MLSLSAATYEVAQQHPQASDDRAQRLSLDGHAGKVSLTELNGDTREVLHPRATSDGRTTVELGIPRFGVRTMKFDNHSL